MGLTRRAAGALAAAVLLVVMLGTAACGGPRFSQNQDSPPAGRQVRIVTTVFALAEFTRAVGGERVAVDQLVPPGGHAHEFEPMPRDLERIFRADVFLYNGADFEPWIHEAAALASDAGVETVDASRGIHLLQAAEVESADPGHVPDDHDHDHGGPDPHVWLDPLRAAQQVATIADALVRVDPDGAETYRANAEAFRARLEDLDRRWTAALEGCRLRDFVVEHGAFGYLAHRYGLRQVAVMGLAADQEPTPRRLAEIAALMAKRGIGVVYREPASTSGAVDALAAETGARVLVLDPLELPGAAAQGESYLTMMEQNLEALAQGLDCGGR